MAYKHRNTNGEELKNNFPTIHEEDEEEMSPNKHHQNLSQV